MNVVRCVFAWLAVAFAGAPAVFAGWANVTGGSGGPGTVPTFFCEVDDGGATAPYGFEFVDVYDNGQIILRYAPPGGGFYPHYVSFTISDPRGSSYTGTHTFTFLFTGVSPSTGYYYVATPTADFTINPPASAPDWTSTSGPSSATTGQSLTYTFTADDPDGDVSQMEVAWRTPSGAVYAIYPWFSVSTGGQVSVSRTVTFDQGPGTYQLWVNACDSGGRTRDPWAQGISGERMSITVTQSNSPPSVFMSANASNVTAGSAVAFTVSASDSDGNLDGLNIDLRSPSSGSFRVDAGPYVLNGSPPNNGSMSFSATGSRSQSCSISFNQPGTYQLVGSAHDSSGWYYSSPVTITVTNPPSPVITSATSATATQGVAFSYQILATNSPTSYGASGLPAGLSVNSTNGLISGTPSVFGTYPVSLTATNAGGTSNPVTLTLSVAPAPPAAPVINSATTATGTEGVAFSYQIAATNSPTSFTATGLPSVLAVNSSTGVISGTPTQSGTFHLTLTASNAGGTSSPVTLTLNVAAGSVTFSKIGGDNQTAAPSAFNAQPFDVAVYNTSTQPVIGANVTFTVQSGGGLLSTSNTGTPVPTSVVTVPTDADGTVRVYYKQPPTANTTSQINATTNAATALTFTTANFTSPITGDSDNDGLPDAWETQYFGNTTTATGSGDSDSDGLTNQQEYQLGTDPTKATDGALPGAAGTYQLVLATPSGAYLGVKSDWSLGAVAAP